ncbi:MAG: anti-sigma factor antagonist [Clostridiales bacterium]|nr:anti-sigma factor antagonist [Clostridiales bacterium]
MDNRTITYEAMGDTLIIHMPKELDHHNCRSLKGNTDLLLEGNYIGRIIFDFTATTFMDSSGIGVLLNRYKQMAASRGLTSYYGAGPQVGRILEMGGIRRLIPGFKTREEAVKGCEKEEE